MMDLSLWKISTISGQEKDIIKIDQFADLKKKEISQKNEKQQDLKNNFQYFEKKGHQLQKFSF